jgi:uncharacterized protein with GYD domain
MDRQRRRMEHRMSHFVLLMNWTDAGVRSFRDSVDRADGAREALKAKGVDLTDIYWTIGAYDLVCICEAPDDATLSSALLALGAQGNLRTTTLRGFTADEFRGIIQNAG